MKKPTFETSKYSIEVKFKSQCWVVRKQKNKKTCAVSLFDDDGL